MAFTSTPGAAGAVTFTTGLMLVADHSRPGRPPPAYPARCRTLGSPRLIADNTPWNFFDAFWLMIHSPSSTLAIGVPAPVTPRIMSVPRPVYGRRPPVLYPGREAIPPFARFGKMPVVLFRAQFVRSSADGIPTYLAKMLTVRLRAA